MPLMGTALFNEHEAVLSRTELFASCRLIAAAERETYSTFYLARCEWVRIYWPTWRPNLPDEADNHVMELAVGRRRRFWYRAINATWNLRNW